jgi:hypothetical protein
VLNQKDRYIRIEDGEKVIARTDEFDIIPQSRVVQLGRDRWGWIWNQPGGVIIRREDQETNLPIINLTRWITTLLYSLSTILVIVGLYKRFDRKTGESHG